MIANIRSLVRRRLASSFAWSAVLALASFLFEVCQSWVDNGATTEELRWAFPVSVGVSILLVGAAVCLAARTFRLKRDIGAVSNLARAVLTYASQLHSQNRFAALVALRNNFSETIHILGYHELRIRLGELALGAATILNEPLTKAAILIDDLGWASHLLRNDAVALQNIDRGIAIVTGEPLLSMQPEAVFTHAKGLRHKALIGYVDAIESQRLLDEAMGLLGQLDTGSSKLVRRELAQVDHARAIVVATRLQVHLRGQLRSGDTQALTDIEVAIGHARAAASGFQFIEDEARYTKSLFLLVRLLEACNNEVEAREIRVLRDAALAKSAWTNKQGIATITGV